MPRIIDRLSFAIIGALALALVAVLAGLVSAGPLDPTNPPGPTFKTLQEVEPRTPISSLPASITEPGSYYLTGNLAGGTGANGITIASSSVTVDLSGFNLSGAGRETLNGIFVSGARRDITIRNGSISEWVADAINTTQGRDIVIENVQVSGNAVGINAGAGTSIRNCSVAENLSQGIVTGDRSEVIACTSSLNTGTGIEAGTSNVIENVVTKQNGGHGIAAGGESIIRGCVSSSNLADGVRVFNGSTVDGCTASNNAANGIVALGESSIRNCEARSNGANGVSIANGGIIEACHTSSNTFDGIRASSNAVIRNNVSDGNDLDGIDVGTGSLVLNNTATGNGSPTGLGIRVVDTGSHIEGNTVVSNDVGIQTTTAGNTVIGNTARLNGAAGVADEFVLFATDVAGPTIDGVGVDTATNPYANFAP